MQTGESDIAAAASSCIVCRKSPSPHTASTWRVRPGELGADGRRER